VETWPERLTAEGYHCSSWFTNTHLEPRFGLEQGFAEHRYEEQPGKEYLGAPGLIERWRQTLDAQPTHQPLMHYLHFMDPHQPFMAEGRFRERFASTTEPALEWYSRPSPPVSRVRFYINTYDAEILQVDAAFGEFLAELQERGWFENAWIIFLSDHGEEFYEHGHFGHGNGLRENLLRVPLVIRPPGGRDGADAGRLRDLAERSVPIHAVADLVAGPGSIGLGVTNLEALGITAPEATIPTPSNPAPVLRRASFSLDGRAAIMAADATTKLIWRENPEPGWFASDLAGDPREQADSGERPERLVEELELWASLGWRGLRVTNTSDDTLSVVLRTDPRESLHEVRVPIGMTPVAFDLPSRPVERELSWTAAPGDRLVLRTDPGSVLLVQEDTEWVPLEDPRLLTESVGPPENPTGDRPPMDPALEQKLRALGYLN
jgi:hypothetical protein